MTCPASEMLNQWLKRRLTEEQAAGIVAHVASCEACQMTLDQLSDEPGLESYREKGPPRQREVAAHPGHGTFSGGESEDIWERIRGGVLPKIVQASKQASGDTRTEGSGVTDQDRSSRPPAPLGDFPGVIAHYRVDRLLGEGGFGRVFLAWDTRTERSVAIKVLRPQRVDAQSRERFTREVKLAASIESPAVVRVLAAGETDQGLPYLVMEYVPGGTLRDWIVRHSPGEQFQTNVQRAIRLIRDAANGLRAIHQAGLVHRDVKPSNILLLEGDMAAKITDFGVARNEHADSITLTGTAELVGTFAYMSPEHVFDGKGVDARSDVFSLGATLYHALTGQPPFAGTTQAVLRQIVERDPIAPRQLNGDLPRDVETICLKSLAKSPGARYQSAGELADDLQRYLDGQPIVARPLSAIGLGWRWCQRHRALAITAGLLALSLVAGTITSTILWWRSEHNAAVAQQRADDLVASRNRLRQAVDSFHSRVFAEESLYWQMSPSFREQMFRDVLAYLDEFASMEDANNQTKAELIDDYLSVGRIGMELGNYAECEAAASRGVTLAKQLTESDPKSFDAWRLRRDTTRVLLASRQAAKRAALGKTAADEDDSEIQTLRELSKTAIECAQQCLEFRPDDIPARVAYLVSCIKYQELLISDSTPEQVDAELTRLREELISLTLNEVSDEQRGELFEAQIESLTQFAQATTPDRAIDLFEQVASLIERYRENLRTRRQPLFVTDRLQGANEANLARMYWEMGEKHQAITHQQSAVMRFGEAFSFSPQSRVFRQEAAEALFQLGTYLAGFNQHAMAGNAFTDAAKHFSDLNESDPDAIEPQLWFLKSAARASEAWESHGTANRALEMSRLLAGNALLMQKYPERCNWACHVRLWALVRSVKFASSLGQDELVAQLTELSRVWVERGRQLYPTYDWDRAAEVFANGLEVERPSGL